MQEKAKQREISREKLQPKQVKEKTEQREISREKLQPRQVKVQEDVQQGRKFSKTKQIIVTDSRGEDQHQAQMETKTNGGIKFMKVLYVHFANLSNILSLTQITYKTTSKKIHPAVKRFKEQHVDGQ